MADPTTTPGTGTDPATGATPPVTTPGANWYDGKASAEDIGLWQNKQWDHTNPASVALAATKAYQDAQKFIGVPPDEIVRFPKNPVAPEWQNVWDRLGVPKDATGYDLTAVKFADGTPLDPKADAMLRAAALKSHVPAAAMPEFAGEFTRHMDGVRSEQAAVAAAALATERAALQQNWGANLEVNKYVAAQGAKALGLDEVTLTALEKTAGYAKTMEALRRVGTMNKEGEFVSGSVPGSQGVMTQQQAVARMAELKRDPAWRDRLLAGDATAGREFASLTVAMTG